jgi:hypothetical protein
VSDRCTFSTYGYPCGKPVEHGRYLCEEHAASKCSSCGQPATHGCDFCGQFVCGAPLCDECTFGTDTSKSAGAWGFMNHIHVSKPEFADKHENARLKSELAKLREENERLREALNQIAEMANWQIGVPTDTEAAKEHARIAHTTAETARAVAFTGGPDAN